MKCLSFIHHNSQGKGIKVCLFLFHKSINNQNKTPNQLFKQSAPSRFFSTSLNFASHSQMNQIKNPQLKKLPLHSPIVSNYEDNWNSITKPIIGEPDNLENDRSSKIEKNQLSADPSSWEWLNEHGPGFSVSSKQIKILSTPSQFYNELIRLTKSARKRVTIASLYIGTGELEQKLIKSLGDNIKSSPDLKVKILLDYARGSRGINKGKSSRDMILPLFKIDTNHQFEVHLYHTPTLRGVVKMLLPQRYNELIGIQHMKLYIFDDSIIVTGANLSNDYFTNRQDRYFLIEDCKELANYLDGLASIISFLSLRLNHDNTESLNPGWSLHPAQSNSGDFIKSARSLLLPYIQNHEKNKLNEGDTWIFPLVQMGPFNIKDDEEATERIFSSLPCGSLIKLATGYFNLTSNYIKNIVWGSRGDFQILMAHPKANGFLGAKGPAGGIPSAYTLLASRFYELVHKEEPGTRVGMYEYFKPYWTFHAKGLWFYAPHKSLPSATLIGSPNFGYRSVYRDLEMQLYLITTNEELMRELHEEQKSLYSSSTQFTEEIYRKTERKVPLWVHIVIKIFKNFF